MRRFLFIFLSVCYQLVFGQNNESFSLSGNINLDSGTIQLVPVNEPTDYPDSILNLPVQVKSGNFNFEGKIPHPLKIKLQARVNDRNVYVSDGFYLVADSQTVHCKLDTSTNDRETPIIHNPVMDEYLKDFWFSERHAMDTIKDYNIRQKEVRQYVIQYAGKHPDSYVALWEIGEDLKHGYDGPINEAFNSLTQGMKTSFTGTRIANDLQHLELTDIGRPFPDIKTISLSGKNEKISYRSLKAKYVLLDFWFGHCSACIAQFPDYIKIVDAHHNKGFIMFGISIDATSANIATWKEVIHSHSLNWVQYRTDDVSIKNLQIKYFPSNFLLDSEGKIIAKDLEPAALAAFLKEKL